MRPDTPLHPGLRPARAGALTLTALAARLGLAPSSSDARVSGVTSDSRAVRPGDLYAALPGARHHGAEFAAAAATG
ncbi:MAG TPA: Mur ligase domain-containing protein, partial [Mycobacteriales bacterium]|nr:Mur ligase domain-containing protein [Mycobacteriales bacterium]